MVRPTFPVLSLFPSYEVYLREGMHTPHSLVVTVHSGHKELLFLPSSVWGCNLSPSAKLSKAVLR
jgi:hypothetical protein